MDVQDQDSSNEANKVVIFGKKISSLHYVVTLFSALFFVSIIWPILSQSYLFIPGLVCMAPCILPEFIENEIPFLRGLIKPVLYIGMAVTTFIYVPFFVESSMFVKGLHVVVYFSFAYLYSKKFSSR